MFIQISKFDISAYLDNKEMIAEYLSTVLEEGDNADLIKIQVSPTK